MAFTDDKLDRQDVVKCPSIQPPDEEGIRTLTADNIKLRRELCTCLTGSVYSHGRCEFRLVVVFDNPHLGYSSQLFICVNLM